MEQLKNLIPQALSTLRTATETQPRNTNLRQKIDDGYFKPWIWLVGNETAEEITQLAEMRSEAVNWCCDIAQSKTPRWLSLLGHSGTGKTLLASRCQNFMLERGESIYESHRKTLSQAQRENYLTLYGYVQEGAVLVKWSGTLDKARDGDYGQLSRAKEDWVKIIDDIGAESVGRDGLPTPFAISTLAKLCDARIGKWTVLTSNFTRKQLAERFDARIASRMMRDGNVIVENTVRDFNLRKEAAKPVSAFQEVRQIMKGEP